jgi:hypothetical protein
MKLYIVVTNIQQSETWKLLCEHSEYQCQWLHWAQLLWREFEFREMHNGLSTWRLKCGAGAEIICEDIQTRWLFVESYMVTQVHAPWRQTFVPHGRHCWFFHQVEEKANVWMFDSRYKLLTKAPNKATERDCTSRLPVLVAWRDWGDTSGRDLYCICHSCIQKTKACWVFKISIRTLYALNCILVTLKPSAIYRCRIGIV